MTSKPKRRTICFDPALHKALRLEAAETEQSIAELVNETVRVLLGGDAEDFPDVRNRNEESTISFEDFIADLRERGQI